MIRLSACSETLSSISYKMIGFMFLIGVFLTASCSAADQKFPDGFLFGVGSSAYQTEGAWNEDGKGENVWDHWTHTDQYLVLDGRNADVSSDSYHKNEEDLKLLQELGVDFYRMSISWSRILPNGLSNYVNEPGLNYYKGLLSSLKRDGIRTMVVMFNWDTPLKLQHLGAWVNSRMINYFFEYAKIVIDELGDLVDYWLTFHDPYSICMQGQWTSGIHDYTCMHNILKAHAEVYHYYKESTVFEGTMSISFHSHWYSTLVRIGADKQAAERMMQFSLGWYANPIFSGGGDYPQVMKDRIKERSTLEGYNKSRLPEFSEEEVQYIKGTADFFALSHFTSYLAFNNEEADYNETSFANDVRVSVMEHFLSSLSASDWLRVYPTGFRDILKWVDSTYNNPDIYITANGYSDNGEVDDEERISYHKSYLSSLLDAIIKDGVNVKGYTVWSFLDSFEWTEGYSHRFGIYHVNFTQIDRPRTGKSSSEFYKLLVKERTLNCSIC